MGCVCNTYGGNEKCIHFGLTTFIEEVILKTGAEEGIILKWELYIK
jgi:hypothetical protein